MWFLFVHSIDKRLRMLRAVDSQVFSREFSDMFDALNWIEQNDAEIDWPRSVDTSETTLNASIGNE